MKSFVLAIVFLFSSLFSFSQLAGTYTIGGSNPNYNSIQGAINAIDLYGTSDTVLFLIRDGVYNQILTFEYNKPDHPVIFQSESLNADSVIIQSSSNNKTIEFHQSNNFEFHYLTIKYSVSGGYVLYGGNGCNNLRFEGCIIESQDFWAITLSFLKNFYFVNNIVYGITRITFTTGNWYVKTYGNEFYGETEIRRGNIESNYFDGPELDVGISYYVRNNIIKGVCRVGGGCENIINNEIENLDISQAHTVNVYNNVIDNISVFSTDLCYLVNNHISGDIHYSHSDYGRLVNNYVYGYVSIHFGHGFKILFNNFHPDATFDKEMSCHFTIANNNFSDYVMYASSNDSLYHNNYFPGTGHLDQYAFHIDPMYTNGDSLISNNPVLIGKGVLFEDYSYDIDSNLRYQPPCIGANKICINNQNIYMECGDTLFMELCNTDTTAIYQWEPTSFLNNPYIPNPQATPIEDITYYRHNITSGFTDTVDIFLTDYYVTLPFNYISTYCNYTFQIIPTFNPSTAYSWYPETGVSNPNIHNPFITPEFSTTYYVTAVTPCGSSYDSIIVNHDPTPIASWGYEQDGDSVFFANYSICADQYQWYFGDETTSTLENPVHYYQATGSYNVKLKAINSYGEDELEYLVFVIIDDISHPIESQISLYPNPTDGVFKINVSNLQVSGIYKISILNISGSVIYSISERINEPEFIKEINLESYQKGVCIFKFESDEVNYSKKIILY